MLDVSGRKLQLTWWVWACGLPAPPLLAPGSSADTAFPALHTLPHFCPSGSTGQVEQIVSDIRGPGVGVEAKARLSRVQYIMVWSHHLFVSPPCLLSTHCVPSALGTEVHSALALPSRSLQSSQLGPQRGVGQNTLLRAHPVVLAVASSITPTASHVVPSKSVLMSSWVQ